MGTGNATIFGVSDSLEDSDISAEALKQKSGALFGKVVQKGGRSWMEFKLIDSDIDEEPPAAEGWAYIGIYSDPDL